MVQAGIPQYTCSSIQGKWFGTSSLHSLPIVHRPCCISVSDTNKDWFGHARGDWSVYKLLLVWLFARILPREMDDEGSVVTPSFLPVMINCTLSVDPLQRIKDSSPQQTIHHSHDQLGTSVISPLLNHVNGTTPSLLLASNRTWIEHYQFT